VLPGWLLSGFGVDDGGDQTGVDVVDVPGDMISIVPPGQAEIDTTKAHAARVYGYLLGGRAI
jgi:hypothetical protein